jgi:6-pyruvoyltetrahydropterin/6-carboxytetrahydropterin synthase
MFEVTVEHKFAAGHALRDYKGGRENIHGHNWKVEVTVAGESLDRTGLLVDFIDLRRNIAGAISRLDHQFLNEITPFDEVNPSAENIAVYLHGEISKGLAAVNAGGPVRVSRVKVWETDDAAAVYLP